jgi:hypothetical protein
MVHSFFPNSVHLTVPGGHVPDSTCTDSIALAMFRTGTVQGLDLRCLATLRPEPFKLLSEVPATRGSLGAADEATYGYRRPFPDPVARLIRSP